MARITGIDQINDAMDKYGSGGLTEFFVLKNHGDQAKVRILHRDDEDLDLHAVHKVLIGGKMRYVECLKASEKPCALCEGGNKATLRIILTMFDHGDKKVKIWDRGKDMLKIIMGLIATYGAPLYNRDFMVIRNGKAGDTETVYNVNGLDRDTDPKTTETYKELCESRDPVCAEENALILVKTYEEMQNLIAAGALGGDNTTTFKQPSGNSLSNNGTNGGKPRGKMF